MSEIKVGDKIRIYGFVTDKIDRFSYWNGGVGIVKEIQNLGDDIVFVYESEMLIAHRKQCRKLVKMRKCEKCDGFGLVGCCDKFCCKDHKCNNCNSTGKEKF